MDMKARLTVQPNHRRAKKLREQYGDRLVYVRYRYDRVRKKRFTTVELIIDEADWEPQTTMPASDEIVGVRVERHERNVQKQVKQAGGLWNQHRKVWELRYDRVVELEMQDRMVVQPGRAE
ncbi:hypothetical protein U27_07022 [Candidatus Vecturithrix granuli]|uniref:Uncharacterized protein n=1 Tax=Vecturithrix granuli TaxID=1499967 RepID=A0A081C630_VECG1|nr:hypothetical protein U27_07022 [Candidatus Vecturithrix granuli]